VDNAFLGKSTEKHYEMPALCCLQESEPSGFGTNVLLRLDTLATAGDSAG
jgi:hypothetical protein